MKKNNGFTIVEIIVALALLTIISTFFLFLIANHFGILNKTKAITEEVFLAQRDIEEEIDSVKQEIQEIINGNTPTDPRPLKDQTIFAAALGGIEVSYYETEIDLNGRVYFTLVSNIKPEPLEIIRLDSIDSKLLHNTNEVEYGYATTDFSIEGEFSNLNEFKYDHLLNQVEWYVSSEKYNMAMPKSASFNMEDDLVYNSFYFPIFPRDYEIIDNETIYKYGTSIVDFDRFAEFGGRHIVFAVTPAAKSGKLGEQLMSAPIFVSGLPSTENLIMHFDASQIDITIPNEVQIVGSSWFVWKWFDISSIIGHTVPTEYAQNSSNQPVVKRTESGDAFIGQYVSFGENQKLDITQSASGELTVISVIKNRSVVEEAEYLENGGTVHKIEASSVENVEIWKVATDVISTGGNIFKIGGNNADIAEMIIYQGVLSEIQITEITTYLVDKYNDLIDLANISEL